MRAPILSLGAWVALVATAAHAHGPQLQITNDSNKIVTRQLIMDGPYSDSLTAPKSVYVIPVLELDGVWLSRPNNTTVADVPVYPSGPGLAYGYDLADGGPQAFAEGSQLSVSFTAGLKLWNGATFVDPGATQLKVFRGSNVDIAAPPENLAITSDSGPFDSVSINPVAADYGTEGPEVHNSLRFALLGDGSSPTSASPDGVYLLSMQVTSTQSGLAPSDEYFFVLNKNASDPTVASAVASLGVASSLVQYVPEPGTGVLVAIGLAGVVSRPRRRWRPSKE
jgi:PEP-CTERM motif